MSTKCEICDKELNEEIFQNHLFDEHHLLFCQYIGLLSDKLSFEEFVIRPLKRIPKPKKEPKKKGKKKNEEE
jgi:hypothetical protein